ncbi:MAG: phosphoribosylaminoimidazole carboxylase ade2 [Alyxoria varia]|nr:MAG: phosphoribosylaminoimidazole carboxylase ade2 [Alyxoria varia]
MPFNDKVVGLLGGGQLGRMFMEAAARLNVRVKILDAPNSSAKKISNAEHMDGSFTDPESVKRLAEECDVLTVEIEHVDTYAMEQASASRPDQCQPSWETIRLIQDKFAQKQHLIAHGIAVADSLPFETQSHSELKQIAAKWGYPFILKARKGAYDGRGNFMIRSENDFSTALEALGSKDLYVEKGVPFIKELAVMVVKTHDTVLAYPVVETIHSRSICKLVYALAPDLSTSLRNSASDLARRAVAGFSGKGVFGVEMFLTQDEKLLVNEIAPRPHNSGHYTIESCALSQYAAHLRAILDLPIEPASLDLDRPAVMLNILGGSTPDSHYAVAERALSIPRASLHLYDKGEARPGRKMGHVTVTAASVNGAQRTIWPLVQLVDSQQQQQSPSVEEEKPSTTTTTSSNNPPPMHPQITITTGSTSDQPKLEPAYTLLSHLHIPFEKRITSAHRTPDLMRDLALSASSRHIKVIIAAAGGAAHLPGMLAAYTTVPVIGLPIKPSIGDGQVSLRSMTDMPRGEPVLTVGVDNAVNAAIGAAEIVALGDEGVRERLVRYREGAAGESRGNDGELVGDNERRLAEWVDE